jgi:voltage-gated potassium channel
MRYPRGVSLTPPVAEMRGRLVMAAIGLFSVFAIGTVGYYLMGWYWLGAQHWPLGDCAYMTVVTLTTVGYAEILPVATVPGGRLFTALVIFAGLASAVYFTSALTTFLIEGEFQHLRTRRRMKKLIDALQDHIIVCGVGAHGSAVVEELLATRWPLVAIDRDAERLERIHELPGGENVPAILGDATEDEVLLDAGIGRARGLITSLPDDADNLLVIVTARPLGPQLKIVAKADKQKTREKFRKAGADSVVTPAHIGGVRMVSEMIRPRVIEFLDLMLRDRDKNLRIEEVELPSGSRLNGKPLAEARIREKANLLVIAVREAAGNFVYNPGPTYQLAAGMSLIVLGETDSVVLLRQAAGSGFDPTVSLPTQKPPKQ